MSKNDGGPAFPVSWKSEYLPHVITKEQVAGMSLRDWFAGQAISGLCVSGASHEQKSKLAYELADAMIVERLK